MDYVSLWSKQIANVFGEHNKNQIKYNTLWMFIFTLYERVFIINLSNWCKLSFIWTKNKFGKNRYKSTYKTKLV